MASARSSASVDYEQLARTFQALAYPLRLELLDALEVPRTLSELRLRPHRKEDGITPDRPVAKQTMSEHLGRLADAGFVTVGESEEGSRRVPTYAVNPQAMYAFMEDLRRITQKLSGRGRGSDVTGTLDGTPAAEETSGPRFVVVHGIYEGRSYPLTEATSTDGAWLLGRRRSLAVSLDYDPFVSLENTVVTTREARFFASDLRQSKNGTSVNWRQLPKGGSAEIRHGDIVGVGRSLLVFYAA